MNLFLFDAPTWSNNQPKMILSLLLLIFFSTIVSSKDNTGFFTSFDSLVWEKGGNYPIISPATPNWIGTFSWTINGTTMEPGDTFTLHMPCVFKFTTHETMIEVGTDDKIFAICTFHPGDIVVAFSELKCTLLDTVTPLTEAYGTLRFPFTFNPGTSAINTDLKCATKFFDGLNTIIFTEGDKELSTQATFEGGYTYTDPDDLVYSNRIIPTLNKMQPYLLGGNCPDGYESGKIGMEILRGTGLIDCNSIHARISNSFNPWYHPRSASNSFDYTTECTSTSFVVEYQNIPAGYRPFIDMLVKVQKNVQLSLKYINTFTCANSSSEVNKGTELTWTPYRNDNADAEGKEVVAITSTYSGRTTSITTLPHQSSDETITIVVAIPVTTITLTSTYDGTTTSYTTLPTDPGNTVSIAFQSPSVAPPQAISVPTAAASISTISTLIVFLYSLTNLLA
ncbi:uncharacterized protein SPAPADRAFT_156463 [Spathaspora passalidarum NRRL Y-27907]|uniref:Agglutinin-like protein N-terminal domain-containing protein n=1 Tax=Spathaspora passalidarum (strain NRRL Y-27907 / 11-Y1) TaxID=619300 RepID=G3ATK0_SPAPN|nr:uncharacterized protein SPAPADRAFT_156463 [Spathaspora passalidarum NRRL Y-27907]EGW30963.1 hypothetical protein SPAPADRAFT_156463 [Spathaspora passalidarum NRRL Y-27907]